MELDLKTQFQFYLGTFERELYPWITSLSDGIRSPIDDILFLRTGVGCLRI